MFRKCADCCRLKEFRKLATSPEDVARINQAYGQHLQSMFQDRLVDAQWCQIATSTASGAMPWERYLGKIIYQCDAYCFVFMADCDAHRF